MKVVGVGGVLGALGGTATASEHDESSGQRTHGDAPAESATLIVHTVRTLIRKSTNPERAADFFYQRTGLHFEPGDVVRFVFETPDHNVTSYHPAFGIQRGIPEGVRPFSSPIMGWDPDSLPDDVSEPPAEPGVGDTGAEQGGDGGDGPVPSMWLYAFETSGVYDLE